jgi:hypothetical protein
MGTKVSEEPATPYIEAAGSSATLVPATPYMEAAGSSAMLVPGYQTTELHIPEDFL